MLPARGYTFIGLNAVRALSIIGLILVFSSNICIIVHDVQAVNRFVDGGGVAGKSVPANSTLAVTDNDYIGGSTVPNQQAGVFWAVLNRLLIIGQVVVLLLSEFGFPAKFFDRYFPVLGDDFGLGALGIFQCLLGAAVLSHHVDSFALVSAFFLFSVGCLNILVGLIWREKAKVKRSILTWREHKKSVLPMHVGYPKIPSSPPSFVTTNWTGSERSEYSSDHKSDHKGGLGFGRQGEKAAGFQGYLVTRPLEALPRYAPKVNAPVSNAHEDRYRPESTILSATSTAV